MANRTTQKNALFHLCYRAEFGREHVRTTAMLVAVVLCFVAVELPHGLLAFLSGIDGRIFHDVYVPLGDVWSAGSSEDLQWRTL